jgi:hypothetical protein
MEDPLLSTSEQFKVPADSIVAGNSGRPFWPCNTLDDSSISSLDPFYYSQIWSPALKIYPFQCSVVTELAGNRQHDVLYILNSVEA